jgi:hypothetical protein
MESFTRGTPGEADPPAPWPAAAGPGRENESAVPTAVNLLFSFAGCGVNKIYPRRG